MQINDDLKDKISKDLKEGEEIIWVGKPEGLKMLDVPYGSSVIIRWIICLIVVASGLWYGLIFAPSAEYLSVNTDVVMVIWVAIGIILAVWPFLDLSMLKTKCCYCITNQRAIIFIKSVSSAAKEKSLADVSEITFDIIADDRGNIYIGSKLKDSQKRARTSVLAPSMGKEDEEYPLVFHSIINPEEILGLFPKKAEG